MRKTKLKWNLRWEMDFWWSNEFRCDLKVHHHRSFVLLTWVVNDWSDQLDNYYQFLSISQTIIMILHENIIKFYVFCFVHIWFSSIQIRLSLCSALYAGPIVDQHSKWCLFSFVWFVDLYAFMYKVVIFIFSLFSISYFTFSIKLITNPIQLDWLMVWWAYGSMVFFLCVNYHY